MDNFSTSYDNSAKRKIAISRIKRKVLSHIWLVRIFILIVFFAILFAFGFIAYRTVANSAIGTYASYARSFIAPQTNNFFVSQDRINILILGKGGIGHDTPDLTDTMILVSLSITKPKIVMISIPRDIWMDDMKAKINTAYFYGNKKKPGGGLILAKSEVEEIVGVPITYGVAVDFNGFKDVIDAIGGVTLNVQNSFTDNEYPIAGRENDTCNNDRTRKYACRYETISFQAGLQSMDGETALKFVRSRHGDNNEGDDIHREARQRLLIDSILKKILTPQVLLSPSKISRLVDVANGNIETDLNTTQEITLARFVFNSRSNLNSYMIPQDLLITPPAISKYLNQFVFIPKKGITDWDDVHKWVDTILP